MNQKSQSDKAKSQRRRTGRIAWGGLLLGLLLVALALSALSARGALAARGAPSDIGFTVLSDSSAWMDSKACADPANPLGPRALWLEIAVTNTNSTETLTGVTATLSGFASSYYELTADPERYVGTLAPRESFHGYWFVDYSKACQIGLSDSYTLTVNADNLSAPAQTTDSLVTRSSNDVGAGDIITSTVSVDMAVGQIFTQTASYVFPNATGVLLQPTGNADLEDGCFRLVGAEIVSSNVPGIPIGVAQQLYFPLAAPKPPSQDEVTVIYRWQAQCQAESISKPWMNTGTSEPGRYSNKYGVYFTTFPEASFSLTLTSAVHPTSIVVGETTTYTVRFSNTFPEPVELNKIKVVLPSGLTFAGYRPGSAVTEENSSAYPTLGASGALIWRGIPGSSYRVPAATAGGPGILELQIAVQANAIGTFTQESSGAVGSMELAPSSTTLNAYNPTAVVLASFTAIPEDEGIRVMWETAAELQNLGFNLHRGESAAGPWTRLNAELIPAQNPGAIFGANYEWLDTGVTPDTTYFYRLEDVSTSGASTFHGPVSATATGVTSVVITGFGAHGAAPAALLLAVAIAGVLVVPRWR